MPLMSGKSKEAFEHNIRAEVAAGKPVKQAVAIAYSEKGRGKKKKHKAHGSYNMGAVEAARAKYGNS